MPGWKRQEPKKPAAFVVSRGRAEVTEVGIGYGLLMDAVQMVAGREGPRFLH